MSETVLVTIVPNSPVFVDAVLSPTTPEEINVSVTPSNTDTVLVDITAADELVSTIDVSLEDNQTYPTVDVVISGYADTTALKGYVDAQDALLQVQVDAHTSTLSLHNGRIGALETALPDYLPLAGGLMTGEIEFSGTDPHVSTDITFNVEAGAGRILITSQNNDEWLNLGHTGAFPIFQASLGAFTFQGDVAVQGDVTLSDNQSVFTRWIGNVGGQGIGIAAGESHARMIAAEADIDNERVYLIGENGVSVIGATDNWDSGWAGRREMKIEPSASGGRITHPNVLGDKLLLWDPGYSIGVESGAVYIKTGANLNLYHDGDTPRKVWFDLDHDANLYLYNNEGTHFTRLFNDGVHGFLYSSVGSIMINTSVWAQSRIYASNTGWCSIGADATWGRLETDRTQLYLNKAIRVNGAVGSYTGALYLASAGTSVMVAQSGTDVNGSLLIYQDAITSTANLGQKSALRLYSRSDTTDLAGGHVGLTFHSRYSTDRHVHQHLWYANGDVMRWRNYENTAWVGHLASAYTVASSVRLKERVRTAREERGVLDYAVPGEKGLAFDQMKKVRPVLFDDTVQERLYEWGGCDKHVTRDECAEANCPNFDNMVATYHQCDEYICGGTAEEPCWLVEQHVDRPGLLAEELLEIYPKAVTRDAHGQVEGIDYAVLTVELVNVIQYLLEEVEEVRELAIARR